MEYASNGDLHQKVLAKKKSSEFFSESQITLWLSQLTGALLYLNEKKVIHRDLKIQNVFLDEKENVKLGDFGISKELEVTNQLAMSSVGTPYYMSPEICSSSSYSHASDMWMLGCTLYELCTLKKPFKGDSISTVILAILNETPEPIDHDYSSFLKELTFDLLNKDPTQRPTIKEVISRLEAQKSEENSDENETSESIFEDFSMVRRVQSQKKKKTKSVEFAANVSTDDNSSIYSSPVKDENGKKEKYAENSIFSFLEKVREKRASDPLTQSNQRKPVRRATEKLLPNSNSNSNSEMSSPLNSL